MKNLLKFFGIVVFISAIGLSFVSCDDGGGPGGGGGGNGGGGGGGRLTINGLPSGQYHVYINENTTPTTQFQSNMLTANYIATNNLRQTSPFDLIHLRGGMPFTDSGRFIVILQGGNSVNRFLSGVQFNNGSATINFSSMTDVNTLPMF